MKKILLKLSGESLGKSGVETRSLERTANEIAQASKSASIAIVIGGGNIWRFRDNKNLTSLPRIESDYLGMLATVFNATTLKAALKKMKVRVETFSTVTAPKEIIKPYQISAVQKFLTKKGVVILAGGTGKPFVTTDSGAALRAKELKCDLLVKATNVNGVFNKNPRDNKNAKLLKALDYKTVLQKKFGVMDLKAFQILAKNKIPISIFNFAKKGLLKKAVEGKNVGSLITS